MRFTLPKPLHGWREFSGEVGIIVIGVLIALGAQQIVEMLHANNEASAAKQRIRDEIATNAAQGVERLAIAPCLKQRVRVLADGLTHGRTDWHELVYPPSAAIPTALGGMYRKPVRNWNTGAYEEAVAHGDLESLEPQWRRQLGELYGSIKRLQQLNDSEQDLTVKLAPLQFNPPLTGPERNAMIVTLAQLDRTNGLIVLVSRQLFRDTYDLGLAVPSSTLLGEGSGTRAWEQYLDQTRQSLGQCVDATAMKQYEDIAIHGKPTA